VSEPADRAEAEGPRSTRPSPRNRLAAEMRRISAVTVGRYIDPDSYEAAATTMAAVADQLEAVADAGKRPRGTPDSSGHPQDFFPGSPVIGYANPLSPPVDFWAVDGDDGLRELRGRAHFNYQYEGPPTCVHGGVIAQLFDELLGSVNILNDKGGFTGTLTIRYRRPTPLLSDLDLVARQTDRQGRKLFAWGGIFHEGELTAEAEGVFIEVVPEQMAGIVSANGRKAEGEVVDGEWAEIIAEGAVPGATQTARSRPSQ
jgi:hypothetical protein